MKKKMILDQIDNEKLFFLCKAAFQTIISGNTEIDVETPELINCTLKNKTISIVTYEKPKDYLEIDIKIDLVNTKSDHIGYYRLVLDENHNTLDDYLVIY